MTLPASLLAAGCLALIGHTAGWLSRGGAIVATLVGGLILATTGFNGFGLLALFFVSGSLLTYARPRGTLPVGETARGGRTWRQVVANGGWATVGALLVPAAPSYGWAVLTGALAAAQADTWGTEMGGRSRRSPRLITTGQSVSAGTSGGVTVLGTVAGVVGAGLLGGLAWLLEVPAPIPVAAIAGGVVGTLSDSLLGATVQGVYYCDVCQAQTEQSTHRCGNTATQIRGWRFVDNDIVNLVASGVGAGTTVGLSWML